MSWELNVANNKILKSLGINCRESKGSQKVPSQKFHLPRPWERWPFASKEAN